MSKILFIMPGITGRHYSTDLENIRLNFEDTTYFLEKIFVYQSFQLFVFKMLVKVLDNLFEENFTHEKAFE